MSASEREAPTACDYPDDGFICFENEAEPAERTHLGTARPRPLVRGRRAGRYEFKLVKATTAIWLLVDRAGRAPRTA